MTFADGKRANCIDALNKNDVLKTCKRRLKINNSAFTDDPTDKSCAGSAGSDVFDRFFWDMGMRCFAEFFHSLDEVQPKPIEESKLVLRKRDCIQTKIHHISMGLDTQLMKQQEIVNEKRFIRKHAADIDVGREVVYYKNEPKWVKEERTNNYITTCIRHQRSCHPDCCVSDKADCCVMDSHGHCEVCKCPHTQHINASYEYVLKTYKVRVSNWDSNSALKETHTNAKAAKSRSERKLNQLSDELKQTEKDIERKLAMVQNLRNELESIALRPHLITVGDYIDQLIENERESPNKDDEKLTLLKKLKQQEAVITRLQKKGQLSTDDFKIEL
jgi:hypothetical protein